MDLYQEKQATDIAIAYLGDIKDEAGKEHAYKSLYPAYGTYVGQYLFLPFGPAIGAAGGHVVGRVKAAQEEKAHEKDKEPLPEDR